jgi:tetratricopeptide (TPR) repeat protein
MEEPKTGNAALFEGKENDNHPPPRSVLSGRLGRKNRNGKILSCKPLESTDDFEQNLPEEDPVMAIFEAKSKQRVRFYLEGSMEESGAEARVAKNERRKPHDAVDKSDGSSSLNIGTFMGRVLFGKTTSDGRRQETDVEDAVGSCDSVFVWESHEDEEENPPEVVHTTSSPNKRMLEVSFTESSKVRAVVANLLSKAHRAHFSQYRYRFAVKCCMKANEILMKANYPDDHPLVHKTLRLLNNAHHAVKCFDNSAKIAKIGIKYEASDELIRALKMYTIAYRIRRDQLSRSHPSLVVLLNILGSIQVKRGELKEAMQIYELALKDAPVVTSVDDEQKEIPIVSYTNFLSRAVTFREMGIIYEKWGDHEKALQMYHRSLESISEWREILGARYRMPGKAALSPSPSTRTVNGTPATFGDHIQVVKWLGSPDENSSLSERGEMEIILSNSREKMGFSSDHSTVEFYNSFFPVGELCPSTRRNKQMAKTPTDRDVYADIDASLTLHQIAQMHRKLGAPAKALDAYRASLCGMQHAVGHLHPNVAAILGNIGNLQKEIGDFNAAYGTYQEVLKIESERLGISHPEVAVSLHNVATIEAARGNFDQSLAIFQKVLHLQTKLFGKDNISVSITSASMGDVYERRGDLETAVQCYEESLRIKTVALRSHDLQVGRILHKLGKMAYMQKNYSLADSYISRAVLIYNLNKIPQDHEWILDSTRDLADVDAAIAIGAATTDRLLLEI